MIQVTPHMRIYFCTKAIDFRKGIDGLAGVCRRILHSDPFSGSMFIFRNKRRTTLKILLYDGQGFWLFIKRLSKGRFNWFPDSGGDGQISLSLSVPQLQLLLWNGDPDGARICADWKSIKV